MPHVRLCHPPNTRLWLLLRTFILKHNCMTRTLLAHPPTSRRDMGSPEEHDQHIFCATIKGQKPDRQRPKSASSANDQVVLRGTWNGPRRRTAASSTSRRSSAPHLHFSIMLWDPKDRERAGPVFPQVAQTPRAVTRPCRHVEALTHPPSIHRGTKIHWTYLSPTCVICQLGRTLA